MAHRPGDGRGVLDEIGMEGTGTAARDRVYAEYSRVFRDYGIDVEVLSTEEASARISGSHIKIDLVLALDRWASSLQSDDRGLDPALWQRLQQISQAADRDPWRMRDNAAREAKDLKTLRELADGADLSRMRPRILAALGNSLRAADDVKASVAFLRKAQRRHPADYSINASLGWSLRSLDPPLWNEAIAFRRIAVAVRPRSPTANFHLGFSLDTVGKLDEAMIYYQTTIAPIRNMRLPITASPTSCAFGESRRRLVHFRKTVDLLPTDPLPLNGLAWELATCVEPRLRDPARAVTLAKKMMELSFKQGDDRDPPSRDRVGNYWNTLGVAHYRAGNLEEALVALQKSLDFAERGESRAKGNDDRYVCEDWFFLAMMHWKLDRKGEARKWYDRAVEWIVMKRYKEAELLRFRAEAAELMRIADGPEVAPAQERKRDPAKSVPVSPGGRRAARGISFSSGRVGSSACPPSFLRPPSLTQTLLVGPVDCREARISPRERTVQCHPLRKGTFFLSMRRSVYAYPYTGPIRGMMGVLPSPRSRARQDCLRPVVLTSPQQKRLGECSQSA